MLRAPRRVGPVAGLAEARQARPAPPARFGGAREAPSATTSSAQGEETEELLKKLEELVEKKRKLMEELREVERELWQLRMRLRAASAAWETRHWLRLRAA